MGHPARIGDKRGEWLYYAAVTADRMYRVRTADLNDGALTAEQLAARVEPFADKTMSDGLTMDLEDNIYITDMEHSAILSLGMTRLEETGAIDSYWRAMFLIGIVPALLTVPLLTMEELAPLLAKKLLAPIWAPRKSELPPRTRR